MNISEFAKIAGVSKSAVSRYFNDGYLSDEKRKMIEHAIEKTGYNPSVQAQNVRTRVTKLVGVIIPKVSSESCARVIEGINEVLDDQGYQLLLVNTQNNPLKEVETLELFRNNRVDGVIFLASIFTPQHEKVLKKMHVPVVIVGQQYKGVSCVCHDDFGAAYGVTELMLKKGRKKPGYIGVTREDQAAGEERYQGFVKAVEDAGLKVFDKYMETAQFNAYSGYEKAKNILENKDRPDCIFCATNSIAIGTLRYCNEVGIRVPEDLLLASVGDTGVCDVISVPLTCAHLHYHTAGMDAADMLLAALKRNDSVPRVTKLDFTMVERKSTECETV